ncbi:MAG: copper resistance protein B [Gammaproteobacteria bacterium]|nr:copper resistance protein B [Gammaproteobacteria bacterium]MDH5800520.1 copper resistance protein B [Gammaproteobacteria bacterium]
MNRFILFTAMVAIFQAGVFAEEIGADAMSQEHHNMEGTHQDSEHHGNPSQNQDHKIDHDMDHGVSMNHGGVTGMGGSGQSRMQGGSAPPDARDPHAYSGGYSRGSGKYALMGTERLRLADEHTLGALWVDRLEVARHDNVRTTKLDAQMWYGGDYNRVVLKLDGEVYKNKLEEGNVDLLWGHAVSAFWNSQLGLQYESGDDPQVRLALGLQGLAPYWFEVEANAYVGESGHVALNLELDYELLLTQKLVLEPTIEVVLQSKDDATRQIGSGLSLIQAGFRVRYEFYREMAPYLGLQWKGTFGSSADFARLAGEDTRETQWVAGMRFWF